MGGSGIDPGTTAGIEASGGAGVVVGASMMWVPPRVRAGGVAGVNGAGGGVAAVGSMSWGSPSAGAGCAGGASDAPRGM